MNKKNSPNQFAESNHYAKNLKKGHSSINISQARKKHKIMSILMVFSSILEKKKENKGEEEQNR